jgi:replicative DNA helicase
MTHTPDTPKELPHSLDAEMGALGSMLIDPGGVIPLVARVLRSEDFYLPAHRTIYDATLDVWERDGSIDFILLTEELRNLGKLDAVGGAAVVTHLFTFTPTAANAGLYADTVRETSNLRTLWQVCTKVASDACAPGADPSMVAATLVAGVQKVTNRQAHAPLTMKEHVAEALERYEAAAVHCASDSRSDGVLSTGLPELDAELEGGLHPGDEVVIAAETSGGKTALAVQIAAYTAVADQSQVFVASYEMTARQLTDRMVALRSGIASNKLRSGVLTESDYRILTATLGPLADAGIHLRENIGHWTIDDVAAEARALKVGPGLNLLIVDYLQLVAPRHRQRGQQSNREREVAEISGSLKRLALELSITVIALSQLNDDGRVRESRAIAHDADVVLIIGADPEERLDRRTITIAKNRHGARDQEISVPWNGPLMKFGR